MKKKLLYVFAVMTMFLGVVNVNASEKIELTKENVNLYEQVNEKMTIVIPDKITYSDNVKDEETVIINNVSGDYSLQYFWRNMTDDSMSDAVKKIKQYQSKVLEYEKFAKEYRALAENNNVSAEMESKKETWAAEMESSQTEILKILNENAPIYDDTLWETATNDKIKVPMTDEFEKILGSGDEIAQLVWVKLAYEDNNETKNLYMFRLYTPEEQVENSETGIEDVYTYVVPAAIVIGSAIILKKKKYA